MQGRELLQRLERVVPAGCDVRLYSADSVWCAPVPGRPTLYAINTARRDDPEGQHYVSFYVDPQRTVTFYDSYGFPPWPCLRDYWKKHGLGPVRFTDRVLQSPFSSACPYHQLAFAALISHGSEFRDFLKSLADDVEANDAAVKEFALALSSATGRRP